MKFKLFGYIVTIRKDNKAQRLLQIAKDRGIPLSKIGLIKALRIDQPETGLIEAKAEVESLFDFSERGEVLDNG